MATVSNVNFSLVITDNPYATEAAKNATYYYNTQGDATAEYFLTANIGTVTASNGFANVNLTANLDALGPSESKAFSIKIRKNSHTGPVIATSNTINIVGDDRLSHQIEGGTTVVTDGYKIHEFGDSGNLIVSSVGAPFNNQVDYLVVGGGGGGGATAGAGAGGGAGGMLTGTGSSSIITQAGNLLVIVGAGGAAGTSGANSALGSSLIAIGGGFGAQAYPGPAQRGGDGGSGGGGAHSFSIGGPDSFGIGISGQGNPGGRYSEPSRTAGGGGGAGGAGSQAIEPNGPGGPGGIGLPVTWVTPFIGTTGPTPGRWFAGGGGGNGPPDRVAGSTGGAGGGGAGNRIAAGSPGSSKSGGGGGGGAFTTAGGTGGSGVVAIRYPFKSVTYTVTNDSPYEPGSNITYSITTVGLSANARFYYTISSNGGDLTSASEGTLVVSNNQGIVTITTDASAVLGNTLTFELRRFSTSGRVLANSIATFGTPFEILVVAGGGAGGYTPTGDVGGSGGGAGGLLYYGSETPKIPNGGRLDIQNLGSANCIVLVGAGAASGAANGSISSFVGGAYNIVASGGGRGTGRYTGASTAGGSGGGAGTGPGQVYSPAGSGISGQGNPGGNNSGPPTFAGGGGGGAFNTRADGAGGHGLYYLISGANVAYAGGGAGFGRFGSGGPAGVGGGGSVSGGAGTVNTGGGGAGQINSPPGLGGSGGSGIVIMKVPSAYALAVTTGSPNVTISGESRIYKFTQSGTIQFI